MNEQSQQNEWASAIRIPPDFIPLPGATTYLNLRQKKEVEATATALASGRPVLLMLPRLRNVAGVGLVTSAQAAAGEQVLHVNISCVARAIITDRRGDLFASRRVVDPDDEHLPSGLEDLMGPVTVAIANYFRRLAVTSLSGRLSLLAEIDRGAALGELGIEAQLALFRAVSPKERFRVALEVYPAATRKLARMTSQVHRSRRERDRDEAVPKARSSRVDALLERIAGAGYSEGELSHARQRLEHVGETKDELLAVAESWPWEAPPERTVDVERAKAILEAAQEGAAPVKREILRYLAVLSRATSFGRTASPHPLLLVGPPGVGKSSIAKAIAEALNRPFGRIDLGGISDAHSLRGSAALYRRAQPGIILQTIRGLGSRDPVILLDEVDKLGSSDYNGRAEDVLLPILSPEQNSAWRDAYLELPLDLSQVLFIATANDLKPVSAPLRDRLQVIELAAYSAEERVAIARKHLVPRVLAAMPVREGEIVIPDETLQVLVNDYAVEQGVRQVKRLIERLVSQAVVELTFYDRLELGGLSDPDERKPLVIDSALAARWLA